jgi:hypothetical protein
MWNEMSQWLGGWGWFFGLMHLAWWALLVAGAVIVVRYLVGERRTDDRSREILRERYARGEIDQREYDERMRHLAAVLVCIVALGAATWHIEAAAQQGIGSQSSVARGVTVKVTPGKLTASGWEFSVVLDTHSEDLKDDLEKSAVLVVDGREFQPIQWQGPAAGGHHREGVLRFPSPGETPATTELRIVRPGEAAARVFRWEGLQSQ